MRCLIRLGRQGLGGKLTIPLISIMEGISEAYVGQLLRTLRLGGFVTAARGAGGYTLTRPPCQIVLCDVMAVLGGRLFTELNFCQAHCGQRTICVSAANCSLRVLWCAVQAAVDDVLSKITLEDVFRDERQMISWVKRLSEFPPHDCNMRKASIKTDQNAVENVRRNTVFRSVCGHLLTVPDALVPVPPIR
jgi:Rrf2 family iron-sulfur cluster assembly transcriptional regulator